MLDARPVMESQLKRSAGEQRSTGAQPLEAMTAACAALPEPLSKKAVPEAAVADGERFATEFGHHRADNACAGEDHLGPFGL
jgi:hypothetical protein